jgi:hypothetical protein
MQPAHSLYLSTLNCARSARQIAIKPPRPTAYSIGLPTQCIGEAVLLCLLLSYKVAEALWALTVPTR